MEYFYLDGSTSAAMRLDYVKRYNGGEKSIFLISLKAGWMAAYLAQPCQCGKNLQIEMIHASLRNFRVKFTPYTRHIGQINLLLFLRHLGYNLLLNFFRQFVGCRILSENPV